MPFRHIPAGRAWRLSYDTCVGKCIVYRYKASNPVTIIFMDSNQMADYATWRFDKKKASPSAYAGVVQKSEGNDRFIIPPQFNGKDLYVVIMNNSDAGVDVTFDCGTPREPKKSYE